MIDTCFLYVYWNDAGTPVGQDLECPIILAVATLRAVEPAVPIYVADIGDRPAEWGRYPAKLGFRVVPSQGRRFAPDATVSDRIMRLLARPFVLDEVVSTIPEKKVICSDSDIFWMGSPAGLGIEGLHANAHNNGLVAFDRESTQYRTVFDLWQAETKHCLDCREYRAQVVLSYYVPTFNDEAIWCHVLKANPDLYQDLPERYNCIEMGRGDALNHHFCSAVWGKERGIFALAVSEMYANLVQVLSPHDLEVIFGAERMRVAGTFPYRQLHKARLSLALKRKVF